MNVVYGNAYYEDGVKGIYLADTHFNDKNYNIYQIQLIKLLDGNYSGNIYVSSDNSFRNAVKDENDFKAESVIKDKADIIVYWIGEILEGKERDNLFIDILNNKDKAVVGCWKFSNMYKILSELLDYKPYTDLDALAMATIEKSKMIEGKKEMYTDNKKIVSKR